MDYLKEYRRFISSHYLSDAVRMTIAILLPALLFGYYGHLNTGLALAIGALCVSLSDLPGPIQHRRNALLICNAFVFISALLTGIFVQQHIAFALYLPISCFFFSMIGVYGARATSIGVASILIMVLETEHRYSYSDVLVHGLWLLAGGTWYIGLSLALNAVRPYRLIQQVLGDYILYTAEYLRAKAAFYEPDTKAEDGLSRLLRAQSQVQEKQDLAGEMIFKTRSLVQESTPTSRILMMIFLDTNDLLERAMSTHQDYTKLHDFFDGSGILAEYESAISGLAGELEKVGIALQSRSTSSFDYALDRQLQQLRAHLLELREQQLSSDNVEGFINLRHILDSIDDIAARLRTLHQYTSFDKALSHTQGPAPEDDSWVVRQPVGFGKLLDNLNPQSNLFRHSIRITLAAISAWLIGLAFPLGHSYWILLTVIVILKPAYGLTRQRNIQRLIGTLLGVALAAILLFVVDSRPIILLFLAISMIGAYSFMRRQYLVSVVMITLYVLILFRLLDEREFSHILADRVLDTLIGSALAFLFSYLLPPVWEKTQLAASFGALLQHFLPYYELTARVFTGEPLRRQDAESARKKAGVALANFSDAFNRMLSEPKSKQHHIEQVHRLVVAGNMAIAHVATLSYYALHVGQHEILPDYDPVIRETVRNLREALQYSGYAQTPAVHSKLEREEVYRLERRVEALMTARKEEIERGEWETPTKKRLSELKSVADQFYFIYKISRDIKKISKSVFAAAANTA